MRLLIGAALVVALFEWVATALERLGFGAPRWRGVLAAGGAGALLLLVFPGSQALTETSFEMYPGWGRLLPGLFAQAGIAEEVLFRGYLFGHVREGRPFWRAATVSCAPFVAVHLFMFLTLPWPIALASVLLAAILSFPLAYLFELGGRTIWAPAFLHFIVQRGEGHRAGRGEPAVSSRLDSRQRDAALRRPADASPQRGKKNLLIF